MKVCRRAKLLVSGHTGSCLVKPRSAGTGEQRRPQHSFATTAPSPRDESGWGGGNGRATIPPQHLRNLTQSFNTARRDPNSSSLPFGLSFKQHVPRCYIVGCLKGRGESREKESSTYTPRSEQVQQDQISFRCCNDKAPVNTSFRLNSWHRHTCKHSPWPSLLTQL